VSTFNVVITAVLHKDVKQIRYTTPSSNTEELTA